MLSDVLPAFIFFDTMRAGLFPTCGGGIPRSVSTPYPREQWNEQAPGIPRQPAHNHRNCHRCRRSATYLDRGEQGPLYACRGNRRVVPPTGQLPPSLDRTIFRRAPHRAPRRHPPFSTGKGCSSAKTPPPSASASPARAWKASSTKASTPFTFPPLPISPAWRRCCAAPNTSAVNTPSSPTFPKICPLNTTLRRIPSPTPKSTIRSSGTNPLFPVSANGWAEARPSIP